MPARVRRSRQPQPSIRSLLVVLVLLPAACLLALWAIAARVTLPRAAAAHDFQAAEALYAGPARGLTKALAAERLQAVRWLSDRRTATLTSLEAQFRVTDAAAAAFLAATGRTTIPTSAGPALVAAKSALAGRAHLRAGVTAGRLTPLATVQAYSSILTAQLNLDARMMVAGDSPLYRQAAAVVAAARAADLVNREVVLAATAGPDGTMSTQARLLFAADAAGQRLLTGDAISQLNAGLVAGYRLLTGSGAYRALRADEDQVIAGASSPGVAAAAARVLRGDQAAQRRALAGLTALTRQESNRWQLAAALVAGLGLIAVLLIALMARGWWRLSRGLTALSRAAAELADDRLPRLTDEVAEGTDVTAAAAVPTGPAARSVREIAATGEALTAVWHAAVRATAAQLRDRSVARAFVRNAARRSQTLLQRQLTLLGRLEPDTTEPADRAAFAAVAALGTEMQRHATGLLVLAGDPPGRVRRSQVAIAELLQAAAAELGDGPTPTVVTDSDDAVAGSAAEDVTHLVAELAEFATSQTPPGGEVTLRAGRVGRGLAIEVEDGAKGKGGDSRVEAANAALTSPDGGFPADDLALHVAGRLAARHQITVTLRPSPGGGTVAVALLPHAILVTTSAQDTIVDGSLPRIDPAVPPAEFGPPGGDAAFEGSVGPVVPYASAGDRESAAGSAASERRAGRVGPYVSAGDREPAAGSAAAWSWLTASPAPRQTDPPASEPGGNDPPTANPVVAAPLPKRVRQASLATRPRPGAGGATGSEVGGDTCAEPPEG